MLLNTVTPLILTFNEAPNIGRSLDKLRWARDVVVVDSYSTDDTLAIVGGFPKVRVLQRHFDCHANQWNFGLKETGIATEWVLALDADYVLSEALVGELRSLEPEKATVGYQAGFRYCVCGKPLRGSLYPPVTVLYRRDAGEYQQDGHTQRVVVEGDISALRNPIMHDDRKPLSHWLQAQDRYMRLEADLIAGRPWKDLRNTDRLRKLIVVAPFLAFLYCLVVKGGMLDGRPGLYYALQRMLAESLLSLRLLDRKLGADGEQS